MPGCCAPEVSQLVRQRGCATIGLARGGSRFQGQERGQGKPGFARFAAPSPLAQAHPEDREPPGKVLSATNALGHAAPNGMGDQATPL